MSILLQFELNQFSKPGNYECSNLYITTSVLLYRLNLLFQRIK